MTTTGTEQFSAEGQLGQSQGTVISRQGWVSQFFRVWAELKAAGPSLAMEQSWVTHFHYATSTWGVGVGLEGWPSKKAYCFLLCTCTIGGLPYTISSPLSALLGSRTFLVLGQFKNSHIYNQIEMKIVA